MKYLTALLILTFTLTSCATATTQQPSGPDLCLRSYVDFSIVRNAGEGFGLMPGRYRYAGSTDESRLYEPTLAQVRKASVKDFVRNVEAFWYSDTVADLCINTNLRQICVNVAQLQACPD